ncbi:MAG TPA: FKBP-type peptidyl-prolyl cis-trans isomerase [Longimicrobiales bacterium]|nr:FKBP-type peptidyl-prolyl cis-trans isomerase [Longimicrobiales bacterium]
MKTPRSVAAVVVLSILAPAACSEPQQTLPQHPEPANRVTVDYARALGVDLSAMEYRRHSGLYVQDLVVGEGARADSGDVVAVYYTGWLASGRQFDARRDGRPFEVAIGYGRVIDGWDQGIVGMRVGGQRRLVIPPALGYGARGQGPIPSNATLVFDVELVEVENRVPEPGGEDGADRPGSITP